MIVAVECPECGRGFAVNGRGQCRCGAYLVHHSEGAMWRDRMWNMAVSPPALIPAPGGGRHASAPD